MNKEIYELLKKFEKHLRRGYYGDYTYGLYEKDFDEMYEIYRQLGGKLKLRYSCNRCQLTLMKELGKVFFEWKPEQNPLPDEVVEAVTGDKLEKPPVKKTVRKTKKTTKKTTKKDGQ